MALRVVIVAPWGERLGGAEEMLLLALTHCDRTRIDPTVVFLSPGEFEREVAGLGIATDVIPARRLRRPVETLRAIWRLSSLLRRHRPDLLLNWSAKAQIYGSCAAMAAGMRTRTVWWQHQIPKGHWTERIATRLPARAIGCSSAAGQAGQAACVPRRPSFVVNPGIEAARRSNGASADLRKQLSIPPGRLVVGIVGRLQPWKGQDRFLRALAELRGRGRDIHGLVVGGTAYNRSPEYAKELEGLIPGLGLSDRVTMTGQVADTAPYLGLMDVSVNASDGEPFGIVLLEAMAEGVPVVAVGKGGPLDIVEPGVTGVLAESGRPDALADAIDVLLTDPERREAMAAAGERRCRERFTADVMADELAAELIGIARD